MASTIVIYYLIKKKNWKRITNLSQTSKVTAFSLSQSFIVIGLDLPMGFELIKFPMIEIKQKRICCVGDKW
ncbi:uncharacterized protein ASCRUDRAFT_74570 [Ascoidea rubescens DSM 1968]|uniref:Uncharacterized protein n=1 Tax=Ascoidea rubescens DSM 1968 TaxID=1344418 RepID=A0A1D2VNJ8_9ASCO|nr:hypothetical protein ASCRUDRAFT_74570 [Ascoidea rubescens DSM 1968]ODV63201.1 hypothetical protein ASCRUDRAFT_74570 [Ascoidea rubescens DSM 1968]